MTDARPDAHVMPAASPLGAPPAGSGSTLQPPAAASASIPSADTGLCRRLQQRCSDWGVYWRAPDAHGVDLSLAQAQDLLRDALGVEVEIAGLPPTAYATGRDDEAAEWRPLGLTIEHALNRGDDPRLLFDENSPIRGELRRLLARGIDSPEGGETGTGSTAKPQEPGPEDAPKRQEGPAEGAQPVAPIDMVLFCPACGVQHVDAPEPGAPRYEDGMRYTPPGWTNPPHRSHLCHGCGHIWRPADVPTNGVPWIKTYGKADSLHIADHAHIATPQAEAAGVPLQTVKMPETADEAAAMASLGIAWLREHAPERLTAAARDSQAPAARAAPVDARPTVPLDSAWHRRVLGREEEWSHSGYVARRQGVQWVLTYRGAEVGRDRDLQAVMRLASVRAALSRPQAEQEPT